MKTYIFTTEKKKSSYGYKVICDIYRVKNNKPIYVGETSFNTSSNKGEISEVFCALIKLKEIPERYYNLSKTDWHSGGYYCDKVEEKGIKIIEL